MNQTKVALIGAGKIGSMIVELLLSTEDYQVTVFDSDEAQFDRLPSLPRLTTLCIDVSDEEALASALKGHFAVLSATPFFLTRHVAKAAVMAGVHYLDLTEDVQSTEYVKSLAAESKATMIPQCGLAPGFISIVANDVGKRFDELDTIRMCVGALPQYPSNSLNYNLTWSTDGVINEYCEPCIAVKNGEHTIVPPLEHLEHFSLDGINYESFNTSGGLGTLAESLEGKIKNLSYQTIRYPGHRDIMKTLLQDLQLRDHRELLKRVFENALPATLQDVVLIFVTVSGMKDGQLFQETYANKIYSQEINGRFHSAIQITTAASICAVLDLLRAGELPPQGFVCQEEITLNQFLTNRFGRYYQAEKAVGIAA
ncbi:MAG: saccharopine dehydrogenase [SAR86 cluster bacterium]|uniref:Saccharopine dehydrogenase n=1 Tax=SAR86 cluster bacterium TaxID=2030880 RepID=A0A2A5B2P2_9GAMM|nr:MAG: saccharopine dehydrogenase [SAR86 cluster bacterium]